MIRRDFLKLAGMTAALLAVNPGLYHGLAQGHGTVEAAIDGRLYRGTLDGKIFTSDDGGVTWQLHTDLGSDYSILRFFEGSGGQVHTRVGFQMYTFDLSLLKNGKAWRTAGRI